MSQDDEEDFGHASGDCICETCGKKYYDHPMATEPKWLCYWDPENPRPYLHRLCNGKVVKL